MTYDELLLKYEKLESEANQMLIFLGMSATFKNPVDIDVYMAFGQALKDLETIEAGDTNE